MKPSMLSSAGKRAEVVAAEPRWKIKFIIRIIIMVFDFIAIVILAATNIFDVLVMTFIPLGLSIFWCLANIIVRVRRARPMHPGANTGVDLLLWMGFFVTVFFNWYEVYYDLKYQYESSSYYGYYVRNLPAKEAASVFATFSMVLHIALFIWACIDTSKRNKAEIETRRVRIAEKLEADRIHQDDRSSIGPTNIVSSSSNLNTNMLLEPRQSYSSIDLGSRSAAQPVSPLSSPGLGPSSPAPAYISATNSGYPEQKHELE